MEVGPTTNTTASGNMDHFIMRNVFNFDLAKYNQEHIKGAAKTFDKSDINRQKRIHQQNLFKQSLKQ